MTPEKRARDFIDSISDGWGEPTETKDAAALSVVIRAAENDALERAASVAEGWATGRFAARYIRTMKHAEPPKHPTDEPKPSGADPSAAEGGLALLYRAAERKDPHKELVLRAGDLLMEVRAVIAALDDAARLALKGQDHD